MTSRLKRSRFIEAAKDLLYHQEQAGLAVAGGVSAQAAGKRVVQRQHTEQTVNPSDSLIYEEDV